MYEPKYTITNGILKNIGIIEAAREAIEDAPIIPAYERKFKDEAMLRTVYHGTHIEGNDLTFTQAQKVFEGEKITARERDVQEIINYRNVMKYLDTVKPQSYDVRLLTNLHRLVTDKILPDAQVGKLRQTQVVVKDASTGEITFRPPSSLEVPFLTDEFFLWLNSEDGREVHPIIRAGISHYVLVAIHPFVEGNGRVARSFATLVLFSEGYDIKKLFSLEEYFDRDAQDYYLALQKVSSQGEDLAARELTPWLSYFTHGLAVELVKVKEQVKKLSMDSRVKDLIGGQVELSDRQIVLMEHLSNHSFLKMADALHLLPMVSPDTVLRELQSLIKKGIIKKEGDFGRGVKYRLRVP